MLAYAPIETATHQFALGALVTFGVVLGLTLGLPRVLEWLGLWHERWRSGVCGRCGYSRRGLSGIVCPECGADVNVVGEKARVPHSWRRVLCFCAIWVGFVWFAGRAFSYELSSYWLRLGHGIEFYSATTMMATQRGVLNESRVWVNLLLLSLASFGSILIVLVMRRGNKVR